MQAAWSGIAARQAANFSSHGPEKERDNPCRSYDKVGFKKIRESSKLLEHVEDEGPPKVRSASRKAGHIISNGPCSTAWGLCDQAHVYSFWKKNATFTPLMSSSPPHFNRRQTLGLYSTYQARWSGKKPHRAAAKWAGGMDLRCGTSALRDIRTWRRRTMSRPGGRRRCRRGVQLVLDDLIRSCQGIRTGALARLGRVLGTDAPSRACLPGADLQ